MKDNNYHRLLKRQIKKYLPANKNSPDLDSFLESVNQAYKDFDKDVNHAENILEQSSKELFASNEALKKSFESKQKEAQALSQRIQSVASNINEIIFQTDVEGRWTFLNPAWEKISGYSVEESLGHKFYDFIHPGDKGISIRNLENLIMGSQNSAKYIIRYIAKSKSIRWAQVTVSLDFNETGQLIGSSGVLSDISEAKFNEEKIRLINKNLGEAQKIAKLGSWEYPSNNLTEGYWTEELFHIMGLSYNPNIKVPIKRLFENASANEQNRLEKLIGRASKTGTPEETVYFIRVKDQKKWISLSVNPIVSINGKILKLVGTVLDITKQKETEEKLNEARKVAETALQAKSAFLSNMSHEIRTPMNAIMGLTEVLLNEGGLNKEQLDNLKLINYSAENLLVIINDILDYSKIEANKIHFESVYFKIDHVITKLVKTFSIKAKEKNVSLLAEIDPQIPTTTIGDPYRLNQILVNLISNSLKFTQEGEIKVVVKLKEELKNEAKIHFSVRDTGIGIPKEKQQLIFKSFTQANNKISKNFGGTGLGLAITKSLIEYQGGSIGLESQEGVGTNFFFEINFKTSDFKVVEPNGKLLEEDFDLTGLKVLVAEDNQVNQMLVKQICKDWGIYLDLASDGKEALEKTRNIPFDIILMDLQMPEMDGFEAAKAIQSDVSGTNRETPIIALTADVLQETKNRVKESGFQGYLSKPFKSKELKKIIGKYSS